MRRSMAARYPSQVKSGHNKAGNCEAEARNRSRRRSQRQHEPGGRTDRAGKNIASSRGAVESGPAGPDPPHELQRSDKQRSHASDDVEDQEGVRECVGGDRRRRRFAAGEVAKRGHDRDFDREQHDYRAPGGWVD
jgi:hypothetical protein